MKTKTAKQISITIYVGKCHKCGHLTRTIFYRKSMICSSGLCSWRVNLYPELLTVKAPKKSKKKK